MVESLQPVVGLMAIGGAGLQALITYVWYEPPAKSEEHDPSSWLEAGLFFLVFLLAFSIIGLLLAWIAGLYPPYSVVGLLAVHPIGLFVAYSFYFGQQGRYQRREIKAMGAVAALVVAFFPIAFVLVTYG